MGRGQTKPPERGTFVLVDCPDCGLPATVESRGTAGGVELHYLFCVNRHWFLAPADRLGLHPAMSGVTAKGLRPLDSRVR
jgi:hypothetical protein